MNREQLQKDFFPKEVMLKLFRDSTHLESKIELINDYIDEVRDSYDEDVLQIIQNNQIAHTYWMSEQYAQAIAHFEIVVENMEPEDYPSNYILVLNLLIRGNRLLSNYKEAEKWIALAFGNSKIYHPFDNLIILNDYADLIADSGQAFDESHNPLIQSIIDELGFPEKLKDPVETIRSMNKSHKYWARKLTSIEADSLKPDLDLTIKEYEEYAVSCEIEWYRNYAKNTIERLKIKKAQV